MKAAQIIVIVLQVIGLLTTLRTDVNGRMSKAPSGYRGVVETLALMALIVWLYAEAGLYSALLP